MQDVQCTEDMAGLGPIRLLCLTLSGDRRKIIERMVHDWSAKVQTLAGLSVQLDFVDGVAAAVCPQDEQRPLSLGDCLRLLADDVLDEISLDEEGLRLWCRQSNRLNLEQKAVFGATLGHLRAMRQAVQAQPPHDIILEDNCRLRMDEPGIRLLLECVRLQRHDPMDLLYFGWLGHHDNLTLVHENLQAAGQAVGPLPETRNKAGMPCSVVYCQYGYSVSERMYNQVLRDLQESPRIMFRNFRNKVLTSPIDKLLPWRAREASLRVAGVLQPCCIRAPLLGSCIHEKWVEPAFETTVFQLALYALPLNDFWLTESEAEAPQKFDERRRERLRLEKRQKSEARARRRERQQEREANLAQSLATPDDFAPSLEAGERHL